MKFIPIKIQREVQKNYMKNLIALFALTLVLTGCNDDNKAATQAQNQVVPGPAGPAGAAGKDGTSTPSSTPSSQDKVSDGEPGQNGKDGKDGKPGKTIVTQKIPMPNYQKYFFLANRADELFYASYPQTYRPGYASYPDYPSYPVYASYPDVVRMSENRMKNRANRVCRYYGFDLATSATTMPYVLITSPTAPLATVEFKQKQPQPTLYDYSSSGNKFPSYFEELECGRKQ